MKRTYPIVAILLFAVVSAGAQKITTSDLIGTWQVLKVSAAPGQYSAAEKKQIKSLDDAFLKSSFLFKEGSRCSFEFAFEEMRITDGFWKLDERAIDIREWNDRSSLLMKIIVAKKGEVTTFAIDETPFVLEVKKE